VSLPVGRHVLRLAFDANSSSGSVGAVDWFRFTPVTSSARTIISNTATNVRSGSYANQNYGTSSELWVQRGTTETTREAFIKFDMNSITTINSAKLRLHGRTTDDSTLRTDIYSSSSTNWSETSLTWNNRPAVGTTVRGSVNVTGSSAKTYEIDLTAFLKSEFAAGRKVVTLVLKNASTSNGQSIFASDETTNGPRLVIT
jgi:hypothetical protein